MIIDARGINYADVTEQIEKASLHYQSNAEEFLVFIEGGDDRKISFLKKFVETLLHRKSELLEASGYYIIRVTDEVALMAN